MIINAGRSLAFVAIHENLIEKFRKSDNLLEMIDFLKVFEVNFDVESLKCSKFSLKMLILKPNVKLQ